MTSRTENMIHVLELQLEEALHMLRLVACNQRTCLEVEEWLANNHPEKSDDGHEFSSILLSQHAKGTTK
jgi:hypothetical protein